MEGPVIEILVSALEGVSVVGGLSALGYAMLELGVDHPNAIKCEVALKVDKFLLMVHVSEAEMQHLRACWRTP